MKGVLRMAMGTGLRRALDLVGVWTSLGMRDGVPLCGAGCRLATWIWQGFFRPPPHLWPGWVGGFLFSFLGSVLELMSVESQRGLGFGMRIQGL